MTFLARSAGAIRDAILEDWRTRYLALDPPLDLDIAEGSDAYNEADALALELEGIELGTQGAAHRVLVSLAVATDLDAFAEDDGIARKPAAKARRNVSITGTPGTVGTLGGATLNASTGLVFTPIDRTTGAALATLTLDGMGLLVVLCEAAEAGTAGNLGAGVVLTWSSAPTGFAATGTVSASATGVLDGAAAEGDAALRARILDRRRERPGSGNRADWRAWARACTGVEDAYVWPLMQPTTGTTEVKGCVTVVPLGPAQGDSPTNPRILGSTRCAQVKGYVEGTHDTAGNALGTPGAQLRPVSLLDGNYAIEDPATQAQAVAAQLTLASAYAFPWSGTMTVHVSSDATHLVVSGDHEAKNGKKALAYVGTGAIRGGYQEVTLPGTGAYDGGTGLTTWTFGSGVLLATPSGTAYPSPVNWAALRTAVFALFDALGPGDVALPSKSARWPAEDVQGRATLHPSAVVAALMGVAGVLAATVTTPSAAVTPAAKTIVTLGTFLVTA